MPPRFPQAPELQVSRWFNTDAAPSLATLRGKVIVLHAFQMLCPGCVYQAIPQAIAQAGRYDAARVAVLGLHSVFEHHHAMAPSSLEVFLHEFRVRFPVAVDAAEPDDPLPCTMRAYAMRGTPTLILIDRRSRLRLQQFGHVPDAQVDAAVAALLAEDDDGD